ncbi:hypothetical protein BV898_11296 [Hypsibius exemplaris]|uniref:RING-type domain-containing protein n=1 Tax=Hypsibius exemplaris TaxID=2072580 RepID=A0A1W0WGX9_HYPEX|nr:hypothetical protein BV898_11296 [Hypsibius exemplaris]
MYGFFQDAPEDRLLTFKQRVQSLDVFLEFGILVPKGRISTDFNNAEDVKMAQRDTAARTHQGSNASEGVEGSPSSTRSDPDLPIIDDVTAFQATNEVRAILPLPSTDQRPVCPTPPTATLTVVPTNLILQIGKEKHETQIQIARSLPGIIAVTEVNFFVTPLDTDGLSSEDYDQSPTSQLQSSQIGTEEHKAHLQTARSLPGITAVTDHTQDYTQKTYLVTGLNQAAVTDAVRTIKLRVVSVIVRFPGNFFQGAPKDRQLTLRHHVESSHVVLTFSEDTQSKEVLISVEGVDSNVEQAMEMLLKLKTDFIYAEDMRRARREAIVRKHQGSNPSEGVAVAASKTSAPPQEMAECIICVDIPANTAFFPCGHKTFCEPCAQKIFQGKEKCPTCRGSITAVLRLYG